MNKSLRLRKREYLLMLELNWGYRLLLLKCKHTATYEFRGRCKGGGFAGYLKAEGISRRKAYRRINLYRRMEAIWDNVHVTNRELRDEIFPPGELQGFVARFEELAKGGAA